MDEKTPHKGKYLTVAEMLEATREAKGLVCVGCGCRHFLTRRTTPGNDTVGRVRVCRNCGKKRITHEC